jgi:aspartate carbamoyltransferase regulatory subunit
MTKREDLRKEFLAVANLRLMKVEEIRELLSISPAASVEEVLKNYKVLARKRRWLYSAQTKEPSASPGE